MKVTVRIILILVISAGLCTACQQDAVPSLDPEVEEYAVYAALIESSFSGDSIKQVLIMDHTRVHGPDLLKRDLDTFQENYPLDQEMVDNFLEHNQQPSLLMPVLEMSLEYQLLTQEDVDEFRLQDEASGWQLFYDEYPNTVGFIHLSRVGFNSDLSQALVYYEHYHYDQPILGGYSLLTRQDGHWVIEYGYEWMT